VTFVPDPIAERTLRVDGRQAAGVVPAVALVALAGSVAVLTTQTVGRLLGGIPARARRRGLGHGLGRRAADAGCGRRRGRDPGDRAFGRRGRDDVRDRVARGWVWRAASLVLLGGCLTVVRARAWGRPTRRFDVPAPAAVRQVAPVSPDDDPGATWDALSRGEDPTS
jgi:hypothetical protein